MSRLLGSSRSDGRTASVVLREYLQNLGISCEMVDSAISAGCKSVVEATAFIFDGEVPPKPSSSAHQTLARRASSTPSAPLAYAAAAANGARHSGPSKNERKANASATDSQTRQPQENHPPQEFTVVVGKNIRGKVRGSASEYNSERSKIFCGGLSFDTDEEKLWDYFSDLWTVVEVEVKRDHLTGHPKGFGFVSFAEETAAEDVSRRRHDIDGRQVEAKIAIPKNQATPSTVVLRGAGKSGVVERKKGGNQLQKTSHLNKVFVGGLPIHVEEAEVLAYFGHFGEVSDAEVVKNHETGISRGFGFISFTDPGTVEEVVGHGQSSKKHSLMGMVIEVKRYEPTSVNAAPSSGSSTSGIVGERGSSHSPATNQTEENPKKRSIPVNPWKKPGDANAGNLTTGGTNVSWEGFSGSTGAKQNATNKTIESEEKGGSRDFPRVCAIDESESSPSKEARKTIVATSASVAEEPVNNCVICLERPCTNAIIPCGHHCLCTSCSENIFSGNSRSKEAGEALCPVCRCEATKSLRIF